MLADVMQISKGIEGHNQIKAMLGLLRWERKNLNIICCGQLHSMALAMWLIFGI